MTIDEAIEREKRSAEIAELSGLDDPSDHYRMAAWLIAARGASKAAKRYTAKIRELEEENARLRSCLSDDAENARMIMGENAKLRELVESMYCDLTNQTFPPDWVGDYTGDMRALGIEVE